MKKLFSLAFLAVITIFSCHAQSDFRAGYYLSLENDTIRGLINYKGAIKNALECTFKLNPDAEKQLFRPDQIKGFGIDGGKIFESHSAKIITHPYNEVSTRFEELPVTGQPEVNFLEILVKGPTSLLFLADINAAPHYYLKRKDQELKELVLLEANIFNSKTGGKNHQRVPLYKGILLNEFADCPALRPEIEKADFKESVLIELVNAYNKCKNPQNKGFITEKKKTVFSFGVLAGLSTSFLPFEANGHFLEKGKYESKPALTGGLMLNNSVPFLSDKLSIYNALLLTRRNYTNVIADTLSPTAINQYQVKLNYTYLRLETGIQYTFPGAGLKPFWQAGIAQNFMMKNKEEIIKTRLFQNTPSQTENNRQYLSDILRKYQLGLTAGIGTKYALPTGNLLSLQVNYEYNTGFTNAVGYNTATHNFELLTGFSF